ncbi:hypothetical protein TNIN_87531 [Trichonephila inaurata madagascariensis]|uniref:Uncharacterized protein n=1 Tax=Trichonephila inaurata madagascariensis TaxID=2747483 RepID=A0A8X6YFQ6_9ARAC|nr:hypothetical protein TNIN_87531 [Trichonephila inaurata madagascariensis]
MNLAVFFRAAFVAEGVKGQDFFTWTVSFVMEGFSLILCFSSILSQISEEIFANLFKYGVISGTKFSLSMMAQKSMVTSSIVIISDLELGDRHASDLFCQMKSLAGSAFK